MLAIGRALTTNPRLLILSKATEGLASLIRAEIWAALARLKADGMSLIVVDKGLDALARLCERHAVLETGRVAWSGDRAGLEAERETVRALLTVYCPPSGTRPALAGPASRRSEPILSISTGGHDTIGSTAEGG